MTREYIYDESGLVVGSAGVMAEDARAGSACCGPAEGTSKKSAVSPGGIPRWLMAVGLAALVLMGGISLCLAEEGTSPRAVWLASLGDQPTALGSPRSVRDLVSIARRHIGKRAADLGLPRRLWCADFANLVRREAGLRPVPSRLARDQVRLGRRLAAPQIGAIAVVSRRGGRFAGHTGIIRALDEHHVVLISGNSIGRRVAEETVSRKCTRTSKSGRCRDGSR